MFFQKVLKGIPNLSRADVDAILSRGIICSWIHSSGWRPMDEIEARLTEFNLYQHLIHYNDLDPIFGQPFGANTPFISTTAGTLHAGISHYTPFPALATALPFAIGAGKRGHVFYAYLITLGRKSVPLVEFAEEPRDVHVYTRHYSWHWEGEVTAKIVIPPSRIERVDEYDLDLSTAPIDVISNPRYRRPEDYINVREVY